MQKEGVVCDIAIATGVNKHQVHAPLDSGDITFWLPALWFVITSANNLALKTLLFSASP